MALLVIKDAERKDSGPYTLRLKNANGFAETQIKVNVLGWFLVI